MPTSDHSDEVVDDMYEKNEEIVDEETRSLWVVQVPTPRTTAYLFRDNSRTLYAKFNLHIMFMCSSPDRLFNNPF